MPVESVYDRWQSRGINNRWVLRLSDLVCRFFPRGVLYALAESCIDWYLRYHPEVLAALEQNLSLAFPDRSRAEVDAWAQETPIAYSRSVVDFLRAGRTPPAFVRSHSEGEKFLARGGPKVIVTAHMGNWEVGGSLIGGGPGPVMIMTFPERDAGVDQIRDQKREGFGLRTLRPSGRPSHLFGLRRILAEGGTLVFLVDRAVGKDSASVTFRGRRTRFLKSPALLSALAGVPMVPVAIMGEGEGSYRTYAGTPVTAPAENPALALQGVADFFGEILEWYPDQWYNFFPYWEEP